MEALPAITFLLGLLGLALLLIGFAKFSSPQAKGARGEARVRFSTIRNLPTDIYYQFHDVTLPTSYGTTQIDHIVVSRFGIFVIETKNMKGWIFGGHHQAQWTQVLYRDSYKFQNPLHQNHAHVNTLQAILKVPPGTIHSVIVFVGDSTFKSPMPPNVLGGRQLIPHIRSFEVDVLSESEVQRAATRIHQVRLAPTRETAKRHIQRLYSRPRPSSEHSCPICGSEMVLRTARNGFRAGNRFWGCSRYPKCTGVRNIG